MSKTQQQLEEEMQKKGVNRYRSRYAGVKGKRETAHVASRKLLENSIDIMRKGIEAWIRREDEREKTYRGNKARSGADLYNHVKMLQSSIGLKVVAALTCRTILDSISVNKKATRTAVTISDAVQNEWTYYTIEKEAPRWFAQFKNSLGSKDQSTDKGTLMYRAKRVKDYITEKAEETDVKPWTNSIKVSLGTLLIELFCTSTGLTEVQNRLNFRGHKYACICPTPQTLDKLDQWHSYLEILKPVYKPCVIPPKDWTTIYDGGYFTEQLFKTPLIKIKDKRDLGMFENANMPEVYDCVNKLQKSGFVVNEEIFHVMEALWDAGVEGAGMPARLDEELPPVPTDIETNEEARAEWRRAARDVHENNEKQKSKRLGFLQTLVLAKEYIEHGEFYYVWQMDWRGRYYPVSYFYLQPQGPDFGKALLKFNKGKVINTPEAIDWYFIHGANCAGMDKLPLKDRIQWVKDNEEDILKYAEDPFYYRDWMQADSPFSYLAFCLDYAQWKEDPDNYESDLPVCQDATQSGLQILSLLVRDENGAKQTNLINSDEPQDLYRAVAENATRRLEKDSKLTPEELEARVQRLVTNFEVKYADKNKDTEAYRKAERMLESKISQTRRIPELAQMWLKLGVDRSMTKRPVMTKVYNSSNHSTVGYLKEAALDKGLDIPKKYVFKSASFLAKYVQQAMAEELQGATDTMDFLGNIADVCNGANSNIYFTTPVGFPVKQSYKKQDSLSVATKIDGKVRMRTLTLDNEELNDRKQKQAFSPNMVHSLDAAVLTRVVNKLPCEQFFMVHDSFGVLAADAPALAQTIREAYVEIFSDDVLSDIVEEIRESLPVESKDELPELPMYGTLNIQDVLKSTYMFS